MPLCAQKSIDRGKVHLTWEAQASHLSRGRERRRTGTLRAAIWAIAFAFLLSAGGCSGDEPEKRMTADELRQRASAICEDAVDQVRTLYGSGVYTGEQLRIFLNKSLPVVQEANDALHEINPPTELEDEWGRYIDVVDKGLETSKDLQSAVDDSDGAEAAKLMSELDSINAEEKRAAGALGFGACYRPRG
jgi:hypothetical protein